MFHRNLTYSSSKFCSAEFDSKDWIMEKIELNISNSTLEVCIGTYFLPIISIIQLNAYREMLFDNSIYFKITDTWTG